MIKLNITCDDMNKAIMLVEKFRNSIKDSTAYKEKDIIILDPVANNYLDNNSITILFGTTSNQNKEDTDIFSHDINIYCELDNIKVMEELSNLIDKGRRVFKSINLNEKAKEISKLIEDK